MKVQLHQAFLIVDEKPVKLTKSVARQIPVETEAKRWDRMTGRSKEPVREPICKIRGATMAEAWPWLYLVVDDDGELVWTVPYWPMDAKMRQGIVDEGKRIDDPSSVPTVFL